MSIGLFRSVLSTLKVYVERRSMENADSEFQLDENNRKCKMAKGSNSIFKRLVTTGG